MLFITNAKELVNILNVTLRRMKISKSEIAIIQLKASINLYNSGDYISALTLAGASSEIIVNLCKTRGMPFSHMLPNDAIANLEKPNLNIEKYLKQTLNKNKNELKHHSSGEDYIIEAEFWLDALGFIYDTIENYKYLFGKAIEDDLIETFLKENFNVT